MLFATAQIRPTATSVFFKRDYSNYFVRNVLTKIKIYVSLPRKALEKIASTLVVAETDYKAI